MTYSYPSLSQWEREKGEGIGSEIKALITKPSLFMSVYKRFLLGTEEKAICPYSFVIGKIFCNISILQTIHL